MFYGRELILDLHGCDPATFTRDSISRYMKALCKEIDMIPEDLHFWDDVGVPEEERQTSPRTKGTSAVQFILTSTIVIHTLDILKTAYVNIFSCKEFEEGGAVTLTQRWFCAGNIWVRIVTRN